MSTATAKRKKRQVRKQQRRQHVTDMAKVPRVTYRGFDGEKKHLLPWVRKAMTHMLLNRYQAFWPEFAKTLEMARETCWALAMRWACINDPECYRYYPNVLGVVFYHGLETTKEIARRCHVSIDYAHRGNDILVTLHSRYLLGNGSQRVVQGGMQPTTIIRRVPFNIVYTQHAMDRLFERVLAKPVSYATSEDLNNILNRNHQCDENFTFPIWSRSQGLALYPKVHEKTADAKEFKIGYAVCAVESPRWLVVKTVLLPGMTGTPEGTAAMDDGWSWGALRTRMERMAGANRWQSEDYAMLRYFERLGFPQFMTVEKERCGILYR